MEVTEGFFGIITAEVMRDERLGASEKLMFALITSLANNKGYCFAANSYFEKFFSASKRSVQQWLSNLKDCEYITVNVITDEKTYEVLERRVYPILNKVAIKFLDKKIE